ncbi:MAG: hypothetical protein K6T86_12645 [Pirellulales bacterium]|nr:hypothetical protein [Pirellulales bacterium]
MKDVYLEVSFRKWKPLAACDPPRQPGDRSARVRRGNPGINVDDAVNGRPIGIDMRTRRAASLGVVHAVLQRLHAGHPKAERLACLPVA